MHACDDDEAVVAVVDVDVDDDGVMTKLASISGQKDGQHCCCCCCYCCS